MEATHLETELADGFAVLARLLRSRRRRQLDVVDSESVQRLSKAGVSHWELEAGHREAYPWHWGTLASEF